MTDAGDNAYPKITIGINRLKLYAYHGVFPEERENGNWFEINCSLIYPAREAVLSDKIEATLDYSEAINVIKQEMANSSDLLEHAAGRIMNALLASFPLISGGSVEVCKLNPPGCGDIGSASVKLEW